MARQRILVVDDNPVNLKITNSWMARAGYETATAESAERALELVPTFRPHLILTDIQLPDMDGLEFTRRVKAGADWGAIPVVALTALESADEESRIRQAGCDGFIAKPVDAKSLSDAVRRYLGAETPMTSPPPEPPEDSIESLREQFLREGADQCRALSGRLRTYLLPRLVAPLFDNAEFRAAFHQWAGLGGTFGFPQITVKAREAEALLGQPIAKMAPRLRELLDELLTLFTIAPPKEEAAGLPEEVTACLLGKRLALVDIEPAEVARLAPWLEEAEMFYRAVTVPAALRSKALRAYDVVLCNLPDTGDAAEELIRSLQESGVPLLLFGARELWRRAAALRPAYPMEFLASPWEARQVLARVWILISRAPAIEAPPSAAPPRRPVVLVADDDPMIRNMVRSALEPLGVECRIADNGQVALAMARNAPPDLAILDVNMPNKDGFEVLSSMRGFDRTKNVRIMMLTCSQEEADITRGLSFGADDYVIKPIDSIELAMRVKRLLAQPR